MILLRQLIDFSVEISIRSERSRKKFTTIIALDNSHDKGFEFEHGTGCMCNVFAVRFFSIANQKAMAKYSKKAQSTVASAMRRRKKGSLTSGRSGKKVTSRKQAIAIGLSEARKKGAKVPAKKRAKKTSRKPGRSAKKRAVASGKRSASRSRK